MENQAWRHSPFKHVLYTKKSIRQKASLSIFLTGAPFLEGLVSFSGPESYFMLAVFAFKFNVSKILKMIQWNYQLTKQNWLACELGTVLLFNRFWF